MRQDVIGIVLAGGASRRMRLSGEEGHPGKAWCLFRGRTFLEWVCETLRGEVGGVIVVAGPAQRLPELAADVRVVRDSTPGAGPLAGIRDALRLATAGPQPARVACIASCDVPLLRGEVVRLLIEAAATSGCGWAVPLVHGHRQVLLSAMRPDLLGAIEEHLAAGRRDPRGLLERLESTAPETIRIVPEREMAAVDPALESFRDIDTPEDLESLG